MALLSRRTILARSSAISRRDLISRIAAFIFISFMAYLVLFFVSTNSSIGVVSANVFSFRSSATNSDNPVFSLLVTLEFSGQEFKTQFLKDIQPVANHCKTNEPGTLAYEVLLSDKDPLQVLVLERYRDKEVAYLQIHKSSAPFSEFRTKLQAMQEGGHVRISGHSYFDSGVGFGSDRV